MIRLLKNSYTVDGVGRKRCARQRQKCKTLRNKKLQIPRKIGSLPDSAGEKKKPTPNAQESTRSEHPKNLFTNNFSLLWRCAPQEGGVVLSDEKSCYVKTFSIRVNILCKYLLWAVSQGPSRAPRVLLLSGNLRCETRKFEQVLLTLTPYCTFFFRKQHEWKCYAPLTGEAWRETKVINIYPSEQMPGFVYRFQEAILTLRPHFLSEPSSSRMAGGCLLSGKGNWYLIV